MARGYYRIPRNVPANRVEGPLADAVRAKFRDGWPKSRLARDFRLNRRTVIRICAADDHASNAAPPVVTPLPETLEDPGPLVQCRQCGIILPEEIIRKAGRI
jgi:hypothetical protein